VLLPEDIEMIKSTRRNEIVSNRQTPIILYKRSVLATDPYTGEITYTHSTTVANAVVSGFYSEVGGEKLLVNGIEIEKGDMRAVIDIDVDLSDVTKVVQDGKEFVVISVQPRGLGEDNRYDVILRRVTQ
jgi:hypothetical protein